MTESAGLAGHAFLSCVRADSGAGDVVQQALEAVGVRVWRDAAEVWPGEDWRDRVRVAISHGAFAFLACFSRARLAPDQSDQHEELIWAIDELRRHRPGVPWLIPVRFDDCEVPDIDIGAGRTLRSLRPADVFGADQAKELARLVTAVTRILEQDRAGRGDQSPDHPDTATSRSNLASANQVAGRPGDARPGDHDQQFQSRPPDLRKRILQWIGGLIFAGATVGLAVYFALAGLDEASQVAAIATAFIGLAGLALTGYASLSGRVDQVPRDGTRSGQR